jgi:hypothetical protein
MSDPGGGSTGGPGSVGVPEPEGDSELDPPPDGPAEPQEQTAIPAIISKSNPIFFIFFYP